MMDKKLLIILSNYGSILSFVNGELWLNTNKFTALPCIDFAKEYECKFEPEPSWQAMNKGKLSKKQRRSR